MVQKYILMGNDMVIQNYSFLLEFTTVLLTFSKKTWNTHVTFGYFIEMIQKKTNA